MTCKRTICQECATQWDGIYHCAPCLAARRNEDVQRSSVLGWVALAAASLAILFFSARVMVWAGALISGMF